MTLGRCSKLLGTLVLASSALAQQPNSAEPAQAAIPDVPGISAYTPGVPSIATGFPPLMPLRSSPAGLDAKHFFGPYRYPQVPELFPGSSARLQSLVRNGKLYLSARDAISLAIENNLDVEIERDNLVLADTDRRRAQGGGNLRGIDYTIAEPPNGVGGPGSPLLNIAASNPNPTTPAVTDLTSLNSTSQSQLNLSVSSSAPYSAGPSIPLFDPNIFLEAGYLRRSDAVSIAPPAGPTLAPPVDGIATNLAYLQGFRSGLQAEATANDASQLMAAPNSQWDPFSRPSLSFTLTQPLLRGAGTGVNLRYIRIANENRKISMLLFEQQVLETVYGTSRIYFDLVSLGENVAVKQEALAAARKLADDDQAQVDLGTLAPIELVRAKALASSSEFDLTQAQGLYRTEEVILRNLIMRTNSPVFAVGFAEIVPTDRITVPDALTPTAVGDLIQQGLARRPDLAQSQMQVKTGEISSEASRSQALPQLNVYANVQTRGVSEQAYEQLGSPGTAIAALPQNFAFPGSKVSTIYQAGIQLNLPLRNRTAEADAARDAVQVRQTHARTEKLADQIREDIENAQIAVQTSFAAYKAAQASLGYQDQLLQATRDLVEFGQATNLAVIQNQAYLAQAQSTEIAARSNYKKAQLELDRVLGDLLDKNGISLEDAVQGTIKP